MVTPFLTAVWDSILSLTYEVDPVAVQSFLPPGVELDLFAGKPLVSIVGLRFRDTKVFGVPIPFHRTFDEVNLRVYVRGPTPQGMQPGVVFIKELVQLPAVTWVARLLYNERYETTTLRALRPHRSDGGALVEYEWKYGAGSHRIHGRLEKQLGVPKPGSVEHFLTERAWGFVTKRDGSCATYRVEHPAWKVWKVAGAEFNGSAEAVYGVALARFITQDPIHAVFTDGSKISVSRI